MPHSTRRSADSEINYSIQRPMTSDSASPKPAGADLPTLPSNSDTSEQDTGFTLPSNSDTSEQDTGFTFGDNTKRESIADAYESLVGSRDLTSDVSHDAPGSKGDMNGKQQGQYARKQKAQYYAEQFQYKSNATGTARERVQRDSPIIAELRTNVIIKDEFTLVTDLSYHLASRYTRPDSSVMIHVDHTACLALAGTFEPCYVLTITGLATQMQPTTNKRNAALIQSFMSDILSVSPDRGIVKFMAMPEENLATNGNTILGEIERVEKQRSEDNASGVKRAFTTGRKNMTLKKSWPNNETEPLTNGDAANGEEKRSTSKSPPLHVPTPQHVCELPAAHSPRPGTSTGVYGGSDGLRMNGVAKEDLIGENSRLPNGRPKPIAEQAVHMTKNDPPRTPSPRRSSPDMKKSASLASPQRADTTRATSPQPVVQPATNIPITPRPKPPSGPSTSAMSVANAPVVPKKNPISTSKKPDTYLDNVSTSRKKPEPLIAGRPSDTDPSANQAKRRSTLTATPKMPPPPPVPADRKMPKVSKRKSFLSVFRR